MTAIADTPVPTETPTPTPTPTPTDTVTPAKLFQVANGFCTAKILLTALDLDVFELLDGCPLSEADVREELDLTPRASWHFLNALVWLGFLERDERGYHNSAVSAKHLVRGRSGYMGGFLTRANSLFYPAWGRFEEALHTGKPVTSDNEATTAYEDMITDADQLRSFLGMMGRDERPLGGELAEVIDWSSVTSFVDCGGARGNLAATIGRAHPHLAAAVFDRPLVRPLFDEHMASLGATDRVTFHAGDFFADPLPSADVIVFGHVLHDWSPAQRELLVRKAFDAVAPGGTLVVYDPMVDDDLARPMNLVISLDLLLTTEGGAEYPAADCVRWLTDAGFGDVTVRSLGYNDTLVVGHKPKA